MTRFEKEDLKVRLLKLAGLKSTGNPADLASMFNVSERTVKRIVKELRDGGVDIKFSQTRGSYVRG